jgi:8-oxo-dGTP pyrophosphatase MutT (NUDIX family)
VSEPARPETTWDGLPVSREKPYGATVAVWRTAQRGRQWLILHRGHHGPDYVGDWAWTPPAGARLPGESIEHCAGRELVEETGLELEVRVTPVGSAEWRVFVAEAPADATVQLDDEHDAFDWLGVHEASARCLPRAVADALVAVSAWLDADPALGSGLALPHGP